MSSELFRRTNVLFKNIDKLEQVTLFDYHTEEGRPESRKDPLSSAGIVLRSLTEYNVRSICGGAVYGAGLQDYAQGRVSEKKFWKNTLSGKLDESGKKWLTSSGSQFFKPIITLERNTKSPRISGGCACSMASDGSLCPHMAALMIAWVRKPQEFSESLDGEAKMSEFHEARQRVADSLNELTKGIVDGTSRAEDLRVLQKTYSKLGLWAADVRKANHSDLEDHAGQSKDLVLKFSETLNSVSLALMSAIDSKYGVGVVDLYNKSIVSTFGKSLDLLVESAGQRKSPVSEKRKVRKRKASTNPNISPRTARSWDKLIENFASR